ncbi:hypothetical protein ACFL1Z_01230 [Thermodesulfobacteriota bacterium]
MSDQYFPDLMKDSERNLWSIVRPVMILIVFIGLIALRNSVLANGEITDTEPLSRHPGQAGPDISYYCPRPGDASACDYGYRCNVPGEYCGDRENRDGI